VSLSEKRRPVSLVPTWSTPITRARSTSSGTASTERTRSSQTTDTGTASSSLSSMKTGRFSAATRPAMPLPIGTRRDCANSAPGPRAARTVRHWRSSSCSRIAARSTSSTWLTLASSSESSSSNGRCASAASATASRPRTFFTASSARSRASRSMLIIAARWVRTRSIRNSSARPIATHSIASVRMPMPVLGASL